MEKARAQRPAGTRAPGLVDQGVGVDDRLRQLEERLAGVRPNGSAGRPEIRL